MTGLTRQNIQTYVSQHLRETAVGLLDLGYEVNYRKLRPNPYRSRTAPREVLDAQNGAFTQVRITIVWPAAKDPVLVLEGSARDCEGEQLKLMELGDMSSFWAFAASDGQCPCGKGMLSERSARAIVSRARRGGRGVDMYRCSTRTEIFHVAENPFPKKMRRS